jgi:hypothetical protein
MEFIDMKDLDIYELGKGKIRHWLEGKQWSKEQQDKIKDREQPLSINRILSTNG